MESGNVSMTDIKEQVKALKLYPLDLHHIVESSPGPLGVIDLPIYDCPSTGVVKCILDIVMDVPSFPSTLIKQLVQDKRFRDLPTPYCIAEDWDSPVRMDMAVLPQANGKFCVLKILNLQEKTKVECARKLCHGKPYMVDWKGDSSWQEVLALRVRTTWWISVFASCASH